jgi:hypothetical protein
MDLAPTPAVRCPSCGGEIAPSHKFCPSCAEPVGPLSALPTRTVDAPSTPAADAGAPMMSAPVRRLMSSGPIPAGGFTPGMVLAGRYRVIGLLGRGGMGEVYRADDLKLGQPVALKFLPKNWGADPVRRERFYAEVRIARQVSHPNVCRVYDVSELDGPSTRVAGAQPERSGQGSHFLTMEYIDGEDLASLLKRIGSLHGTKALDVARQLCAGLAAAHNKGVLHRDLKPANVMIDGRGHVRITDFGLAVAAGDEVAAGDIAGTPAYMAPEQFAGKGASVQSDIYALGLVLYELYTGRRAFDATSLAELRAKKEGAPPPTPSEITRDIDPIVERVILRCIDKDPRQRPASVMQVAAALPGGDPLAAALAAGETPSPEMVAASGSTEGLRPWIAWACLAFVILGIGAVVGLGRQVQFIQRVPVEQSPDVMAKTARDILKNAGYSERPGDSAFGFQAAERYRNIGQIDRSPTRWGNPPAFAIQFWYRQSPVAIEHWSLGVNQSTAVPGGVDFTDPPVILPGEAVVWLDSRGRLLGLRVIAREERRPTGASQLPDWSRLFQAAGIDPEKCTPADPERVSLVNADARWAWTGVLPDRPDVAMRIEASAYRGTPVSWRMFVPSWNPPSTRATPLSPGSEETTPETASIDICEWTRATPSLPNPGESAGNVVRVAVFLGCLAGALFFARRNLRLGRGDRRGAASLAWFAFGTTLLAWVFGEHHVPTAGELDRFAAALGVALWNAGFLWLAYTALEPFVRRRWPGLLIVWNRVIAGRFRDPLVGRELLVGCVVGVVWALLNFLRYPVAEWSGAPSMEPSVGVYLGTLYLFSGVHAIVAGVSGLLGFSMWAGFGSLSLIFLLRFMLRRTWAAAIAYPVIMGANFATGFGSPLINWTFLLLLLSLLTFVLLRFGPLAFAAALAFASVLMSFPITMQLSAWYFGIGLTGLGLLLAVTLYGFYTSLGGQPLFGRATLEE